MKRPVTETFVAAAIALITVLAACASTVSAQTNSIPRSDGAFDKAAGDALSAMKQRATELNIKGAAVVAFISGDEVTGWESKMVVVGAHRNDPTANNRGANLIAIAYSKASEMADTLKNSGSAGRPRMDGETGYRGGLIQKVKTGYVIAAFSGGPDSEDLKVSRAGLDVLAGHL